MAEGARVGVAGQLPAGMEFETDNIAANQGVVPVLFKAKADAPVGGSLIPVPGGVLIKDASGALLGAVGISGGSVAQDFEVAQAALAAFEHLTH